MTQHPAGHVQVGVVVERRKGRTPWAEWVWRPVSVLPGVPDIAPWSQLAASEELTTFYAGTATVSLFRADTARYRDNLASGHPQLWVVLRPTQAEPPFDIAAVTADPAEGEGYTETGADLVEAVPMPAGIAGIVSAFVAAHHVERPFVKRKRDQADPEVLARRGRAGEGERR